MPTDPRHHLVQPHGAHIHLVTWVCALCIAPLTAAQTVTTSPTSSPSSGTPKLEVSTAEWNFGERWSGQPAKTKIALTNVGDAPLHIVKIKTGCDCTVATLKRDVLQPGELAEIDVSYNTLKGSKKASDKIRVHSNDPENPITTIQVTGRVNPVVETGVRGIVSFGVLGREDVVSRSLDIECTYIEPLDLKIKVSDAKHVDIKLETIKEGRRYKLTATTTPPLPDGTVSAKVALLTGLGFRPEVPINISGYVAPRIAVVPEVLVVPNRLRVPMRRLLQIRYRVGEKPFRITGITVSDPEIKTEISEPTAKAPKNVGGFEVIRIVVTLPARDKPLTDVETITITTDDEDYRELVVLLRPGKVPAAQPAGPQTPEVGPADQPDP